MNACADSQFVTAVAKDDENRENEGDLIMSAEQMTPEWMSFFVRHTSGVICCALRQEKAETLELPPMVVQNEDAHQTAFTVSVDATDSTTGISAVERSKTCKALARSSNPTDFRRPGHIFPLVARNGGVLERRGHTEASVDLCRLANMTPCGVLFETTTRDGREMARLDELIAFAREFELPIVSIDDLVMYQS